MQNNARTTRRGWIGFDFANSSYHLLVPTILLPLFFRGYIAGNVPNQDFLWACIVAGSVLTAAVFGPIIGAFADVRRKRLFLLTLTTLAAAVAGALIPLVPHGGLILGSALFGVSHCLFIISLGLYDSFLPVIAPVEQRGRLSGIGWGLGYIGGLVCLLIVMPLLGNATVLDDPMAFKLAIWVTCAFYAAAAAPALWMMRRVESNTAPKNTQPIIGSLTRIKQTLSTWRSNGRAFRTLVSFYLANDGLATLVYFTSIYAATTLEFTSKQIMILFIIVQIVAVPATLISGRIADRIGHKQVISSLLVVWILLCAGFALSEGMVAFCVLSIGTGIVIGSTPALYRSLLANNIPHGRESEFYGFNSLASRASSVVGPLLFGAIASATSSQRLGMVSLIPFFFGALLVLRYLPDHSAQGGKRAH